MSQLKVFNAYRPQEVDVVNDGDISQRLADIGVRFERWQASVMLTNDSSQDEILNAYQSSIDQLKKEYEFQSADVIALTPGHPEKEALRTKFLDEHTHSDFEVRFFVEGSGLFYIHVEDKVYGVLCQAGDLISVPANAKHWFDMGPAPAFTCIRLFTSPEGWVAKYTGDEIAQNFPLFDQF